MGARLKALDHARLSGEIELGAGCGSTLDAAMRCCTPPSQRAAGTTRMRCSHTPRQWSDRCRKTGSRRIIEVTACGVRAQADDYVVRLTALGPENAAQEAVSQHNLTHNINQRELERRLGLGRAQEQSATGAARKRPPGRSTPTAG